MKLLIITQAMDQDHPILGFFHRWVEEFAVHCEHVHVICLQAGTYNLPPNVTIHSLGKERGKGKFTYLIRFYQLIFSLRHQYDSVFVHMNQIYVILGVPVWRALGKRVGLWYMHGAVSRTLRIAEKFTNKIFTGSNDSFKIESNKVVVTGHGIDTVRFSPHQIPKDLDLITVGRITPAKNLTTLITILANIRKSVSVTLVIVGATVTKEEKIYEEELRALVAELELGDAVIFTGKVSQENLPGYLNRAKVFVTTAQNGSLDKAMLEAMACGVPVVSLAPGSRSLPLGDNQVLSQETFVFQVQTVLESKKYIDMNNSAYVQDNHSLKALIPKIIHSLQS